MKLVELQPIEFDNFVKAEPNASIYQTSNWAKFYSTFSYTPLYIGYVGDNGVYTAFGLLLVKKGKGFFAKKEAICPCGFLINYYDSKLLKMFVNDLKVYMFRKRINKLIINPNIKYKTRNGNNEYLISVLKDVGFVYTKDNYIYETDISCIKPYIQKDIISLNSYVIDSHNIDKLFKINDKYESLYNAFDKKIKFIVCELNYQASIDSINNAIDENAASDTNNENSLNCENDSIVKNKENLKLIEKCVDENGDNPILGVTCLVEYDSSITQLCLDIKDGYETFNIIESLNEKTSQVLNELGYNSFYGYIPYPESNKIDYIGEFTLNR